MQTGSAAASTGLALRILVGAFVVVGIAPGAVIAMAVARTTGAARTATAAIGVAILGRIGVSAIPG